MNPEKMRMVNLKIAIVTVWVGVLFSFFIACSDGDKFTDHYDRSLILVNLSDNIIIPAYEDFKAKTILLEDKIGLFQTTPSELNLGDAKEAWIDAKLSWMQAEIFNFGPVDDFALETTIDLWPTSQTGIEQSIDNYDESDNYLNQIGSNKKGLPAIEYLLFHGEPSDIVQQFSNDQKRVSYLGLLAQELKISATTILDEWKNNYQSIFISSIGNTANSGMTLLSNELIQLTEKVKNFKIAIPLGLSTLSDPLPDQVESLFAHLSLSCIDQNLIAIEAVFNGGMGAGFDDYLDELKIEGEGGVKLSEIINNQISICRESVGDISLDLEDAVINEDQKVLELYNDIQKLTILLKTDMMSRLGLLVIFSDNDGD